MKRILSSGLVIGAMVSLVGCGGGSSSDTLATDVAKEVTGQFIDAAVAGLNYACSSGRSDVTNDKGEYTCLQGDTVTFSLGGYVLGSATASSGMITPADIQPDSADAAMNVAQLLQSLDTDPTDDIISIDGNFTALDDVNISLDDPNFDDLMETELEIALVTEEVAQAHLDESKVMVLLAAKTFYNVGSDSTGDNWIDKIEFNSDATSLVWTSLTDSESGTFDVAIDGDTVALSNADEAFELVFVEEASDMLVFHGLDSNGATVEEDFMFFDQAAAQEYYDSLQPTETATDTTTSTSTTTTTDTTTSTSTVTTEAALRDLLADKTLYNEQNYEAWTFNADVTLMDWVDVDAINVGSTNSGTETFILSGTTATLNGGMVVTLEIFDQYITMSTGTQSENLWYNLAEMEAANPQLLQY